MVWVSKAQQNGRPVICSRGARALAALMMGANVISSSQQSAELRFSAVALTPLSADPDSPRPLTAYLPLPGITLHLVPWWADSLAICRVSAPKPACIFLLKSKCALFIISWCTFLVLLMCMVHRCMLFINSNIKYSYSLLKHVILLCFLLRVYCISALYHLFAIISFSHWF